LPVATIILSVVLQKIVKDPLLVALTAFAIYLIVTYSAFDSSFLIFAIVYSILAFLSAYITILIRQHRICNDNITNAELIERINTQNLNRNVYDYYYTGLENINVNSNFESTNCNNNCNRRNNNSCRCRLN
jgi:hypothetical protein